MANETLTFYRIGSSQPQMVHEQPQPTESKLKNILLGTPEQRKQKSLEFIDRRRLNPLLTLSRRMLEPGYVIREMVYEKTALGKLLMITQGVLSTFYQTSLTRELATKLGEYLGQ